MERIAWGVSGTPLMSMAMEPHGRKTAAVAEAERAADTRDAFTSFVGQTFFGQLLHAMRSSAGKPAYFHGGQAEEVFRGQLDQILAGEMAKKTATTLAEPMFRQQFPGLAEALS